MCPPKETPQRVAFGVLPQGLEPRSSGINSPNAQPPQRRSRSKGSPIQKVSAQRRAEAAGERTDQVSRCPLKAGDERLYPTKTGETPPFSPEPEHAVSTAEGAVAKRL